MQRIKTTAVVSQHEQPAVACPLYAELDFVGPRVADDIADQFAEQPAIYDDDKNLFAALKAGAQGYILKDQDKDKIISHLLGLQQDRPAISAATSRRLISHFNQQGNELTHYKLTTREHEVLVMLSKGYTIEQTADALHIAVETVRGYVKSLYSKLGINNRAELTLIAVRLGLAN